MGRRQGRGKKLALGGYEGKGSDYHVIRPGLWACVPFIEFLMGVYTPSVYSFIYFLYI